MLQLESSSGWCMQEPPRGPVLACLAEAGARERARSAEAMVVARFACNTPSGFAGCSASPVVHDGCVELCIAGYQLVPWGMAVGSDGALYVAVDLPYEARPPSNERVRFNHAACSALTRYEPRPPAPGGAHFGVCFCAARWLKVRGLPGLCIMGHLKLVMCAALARFAPCPESCTCGVACLGNPAELQDHAKCTHAVIAQ